MRHAAPMDARLQEIVIDAVDVQALASFWGALLDAPVGRPFPTLMVVGSAPLLLVFQQVPERKSSTKNRVHLDIEVDDLDRGVEHVVALGARRVGDVHRHDEGGFVVMADPEGNEFCLVVDSGGAWAGRVSRALSSAVDVEASGRPPRRP